MRTRSASRLVKIDSSCGTDVAALFTWLANNIGHGRYSDHTAYGTHCSRCANGFDWAQSIARFAASEVMPEAAHDRYDAVYAEPARHRHVPRHTDPTREVAVGPRCGAAGWMGGRRSRPHVATVCRVGIPDPDRVGLGCPRPRPRRIDIGLGPGGQVDHRHKPEIGRPKGRVGVRAGS